ncbi:MAG: hypothetical protein J0H69_20300 [Burkholderiales bacterium]|nr:hypothetical protein [Burkholderiales bacterium]
MRCEARAATGPRAQRGSVLIYAAIFMSLGVILIVGLELGFMYYVKREMQKSADLAALAAVDELTQSNCGGATAAANASVAANAPGAAATVVCGHWNPANAAPNHFVAGGGDLNAVEVTVSTTSMTIMPVFTGNRTVVAQATAAMDLPVAAFTVGSRLLRLETGGLLPALLSTVGVGLSQADILSYRGLANVGVKPSGLLAALGVPVSGEVDVGTLNGTAAIAGLTLGQLLGATATALQQQGGDAVVAQLGLLSHLSSHLNLSALNAHVNLFGNDAVRGVLLGVDTAGRAALEAEVDVLDLVSASLVAANGANFIDLPSLGVPLLGVTARASVVEPPAIGIGGVGTSARSAQVRLYLRVNSNGVPLVGAVLGLTGTALDLPVIVEVASSRGELSDLDCSGAEPTASFSVTSGIANVCMGRFHDMTSASDADATHFFSAANSCTTSGAGVVPDSADGVRRHRVLSVLGILPLTARVGLPVLASTAPVTAGPLLEPTVPRQVPDPSTTTVNATGLDLAQTATNLTNAVAIGLLGDVAGTGVSASAAERLSMAQALVGTTGAGRSITDVGNQLRWSQQSLDNLNAQVVQGGLGGLLGGVLQGVGMTLNTLLLDPVADTVCLLGITQTAIRNCRTNYVRDTTLASGNNLLSGTLSMAIAILSPALDSLSSVFRNLLNALGLGLGQTDVSLLSASCGHPKLVY